LVVWRGQSLAYFLETEAMSGEIERTGDASISQEEGSKPREIQLLEQAKQIFENIEHSLGPKIVLQIMMDGVQTFMKRQEIIKHLISSPDSRLAHRIERIIHEADPDAAIRFQRFDQWAKGGFIRLSRAPDRQRRESVDEEPAWSTCPTKRPERKCLKCRRFCDR
jgi:hypothetical protein